jgi:membrane-bound lytic murein transglycosylase B
VRHGRGEHRRSIGLHAATVAGPGADVGSAAGGHCGDAAAARRAERGAREARCHRLPDLGQLGRRHVRPHGHRRDRPAGVRLGHAAAREGAAACRLGWTTLAGIGGIESLHGTDKGSYLLPDGQTSQPILGPALDGTGGNAAIAATPETVQWHGDSRWDHAVGPMQFIPSTWERWQSDGNDDGVADPSNVFDAAYAAGRYLCASGGDLRTGEGWTRAIFSYNHSDDYVRSVLNYANYYAAA